MSPIPRKLVILAIACAGLALAGCAAPEEAGDQGASSGTPAATPTASTPEGEEGDKAPFRVVSAERRDGSCLFPDVGEGSCHVLRVEVDNQRGTRDFSANMFSWSGVSADGQVFSAPDKEGPDAVAGGHRGEIALKFDVDGDAKLAALRYETFGGDRMTAAVPEY